MPDDKTIGTDGDRADTGHRDDHAVQNAAPVPTEDDDAQRDSAAHPS
ncbi:hypothetical protein [Sphingomonas sp. CFBP 13720]|nr:hypothetical protein [Sphingomonas sp. CFBP 13720]MBD8678370.1 hypothetical protein [Sphingomonas sp. CFBP 13720]